MKSAFLGRLTCLTVLLLAFSSSGFAQDGPLLPGLGSAESGPAQSGPDAAEITPSTETVLPADDGIAPLDERGVPMRGPELASPLRLPPPPAGVFVPGDATDPAKIETEKDELNKPDEPNRSLWQRSKDALRDLTQPKPQAEQRQDQDAIRNWQMLRREPSAPEEAAQPKAQRRLPQQQSPRQQVPMRAVPQTNRPAGQREWDPRLRAPAAAQRGSTPGASTTPGSASAGRFQPSQRPSARRQPTQQAPVPTQAVPRRTYGAPARGSKPSQPREANNEPRSPWERY